MAVCRVEKNKNYTTMSNYHLRDRNLSNKARGLLSTMLSLPENWDYTTRGLAAICKDGVDGITAQLRELEQFGYLSRRRIRMKAAELLIWNMLSMKSHIRLSRIWQSRIRICRGRIYHLWKFLHK